MSEHTADEISGIASKHLVTLLRGQWPEIDQILDEEEEVKISASIVITCRIPEEGNHADKDSRVKTTISFSKKFSASTESPLEDERQGDLFRKDKKVLVVVDEMPEVLGAVDGAEQDDQGDEHPEHTDEPSSEPAAEAVPSPSAPPLPEGYVPVTDGRSEDGDLALNVERTAWGEVANPGAPWDQYHGLARKKNSKPRREQGWAEKAISRGPEGVKDVLDQAAAGFNVPQIYFLANELTLSRAKGFLAEFRLKARKARWPEACVSTMVDILSACDSVTTMHETLRPWILTEQPKPEQPAADEVPKAPPGAIMNDAAARSVEENPLG